MARISFPAARWNARYPWLSKGNAVRIRTADPAPANQSVLFEGFITAHSSSFTGGGTTR